MSGTSFLIGLTGYAGTGKDTVRAILEQGGFVGLAFAEPIRAMLLELLTSNGIDGNYINDRALKETIIPELGVSYRHMAQTLGTEWGRNLRRDFWLRLAGAYMADMEDAGETHFVISDVRFSDEAAWLRQKGGVIWRVERKSVLPVRLHASEAGAHLIKADYIIANHGTPEQLNDAVLAALETLC